MQRNLMDRPEYADIDEADVAHMVIERTAFSPWGQLLVLLSLPTMSPLAYSSLSLKQFANHVKPGLVNPTLGIPWLPQNPYIPHWLPLGWLLGLFISGMLQLRGFGPQRPPSQAYETVAPKEKHQLQRWRQHQQQQQPPQHRHLQYKFNLNHNKKSCSDDINNNILWFRQFSAAIL